MNGGLQQSERIRQGVFADRLPVREPTLGELLSKYQAYSSNWTPETDGMNHDVADELRVRIMAAYGLTKAQTHVLGEALL